MFTRAALLSAAVAVLLLSSSCVFGGDDDDGETLPTNTPDAPLNTPTGSNGSNGSNGGETPGQTATQEPSSPTPSGPQTHTVQAGEFLSTIAPQYGVTVDEILAANDITDPNLIFPGQELIIPEPGAVAPTADGTDGDDAATEEPTADGG